MPMTTRSSTSEKALGLCCGPRAVTFTVFVVMGALAGLAALLNAVRFPQVDPNAGTGRELQVIAAVVVSGTAFFIHEIRLWGPWSPIHLLAIFTLATLPLAVVHARRHRVDRHRNAMIAIFVGAHVIAGLFTLMPGRVMHAVAFGN